MKKLLMVVVLMLFVAPISEAAYVGFQNLSPVFSPNSDSTGAITPLTNTDDVSMSTFGSVWLAKLAGSADSVGYPSTEPQAAGTYGMGALLPDASRYNVAFDYHLRTYDSNVWDNFKVVITSGNYLWAGGTEIGGFTWGGATLGGLESKDAGGGFQVFVDVPGGPNYYLNVVLITDGLDVSWGRFSDVAVEPITRARDDDAARQRAGRVGRLGQEEVPQVS